MVSGGEILALLGSCLRLFNSEFIMNKYLLVYTFVKTLYNNGLRDVIIQLVNDPDKDWDDAMLAILDAMFKKD